MTGAYVLINCTSGKTATVLKAMRKAGIREARAVAGLYDIVAYVEASSANKLGEIVVSRLQQIEGVERTVTMVAVKM